MFNSQAASLDMSWPGFLCFKAFYVFGHVTRHVRGPQNWYRRWLTLNNGICSIYSFKNRICPQQRESWWFGERFLTQNMLTRRSSSWAWEYSTRKEWLLKSFQIAVWIWIHFRMEPDQLLSFFLKSVVAPCGRWGWARKCDRCGSTRARLGSRFWTELELDELASWGHWNVCFNHVLTIF